ncbi:hypothetical protein IEQ34_009459 [Dendrobium chrysotoxum]|uniref:Uncharacterized protein n=1 Tax=Dendrobium chrysotoxum TaxID=161865 RepID=A0AAV7H2I0_DENCH|nr:hypothetical protein IEQ34_009459 [Dendrobium chrysotoxum]
MPVGSKLIALLSTSFPLRPSFVFRLARYSRPTFGALSHASVFHGRIHSVFNRPKLGFWSGVVNQFHSEAVINEGCGEAATSFSDSKNSHPWPEWSKLADLLVEKGYSDRCMASGDDDDSFSVEENLPEKFLKAAEACLGFARDRPDVLRLLAKKNMETIVLNGSPFLFKNGENSARRMKLFLSCEGSNELELERAQTIDIMRYLLSYAYGPLSSSHDNSLKSDEHVEQSVRKLLCELFNLSGTVWKPKSVDATLTELPLSNDQLSGHPGQYIETKTADWINPKFNRTLLAALAALPKASSSRFLLLGNSLTVVQELQQINLAVLHLREAFLAVQDPSDLAKLLSRFSWALTGCCPGNFSKTSCCPALQKTPNCCSEGSSSLSRGSGDLKSAVHAVVDAVQKPQFAVQGNQSKGACCPPSRDHQIVVLIQLSVVCCCPLLLKPPTTTPELRVFFLLGRSSAASESQQNASCNFTDKEYGNSIFNQKQGPEVTLPSQTGRISTPIGPFIENSAQPSTSGLDKNVESWNRVQTSSISNAQISNESNAVYGSTNSSEPPSHLGNNFNNYYGGYTGKPIQPSGNLWTKSGASYGGSTAKSSPPPGNSWNEQHSTSYKGYDVNTSQISSNSSSNSSTSYGGSTASLSQPPNNSWNNYNTSFAGYSVNSAQPSSTVWSNSSTPYGGSIVNPSQPPPRDLWSNYNSANSTQPSSNSWSNSNISSAESTPNSAQPPSGHQGNYTARYDGYSNASQTGFTSNSSQPPSGYLGNCSTRYDGHSNASQTGFTSNSSQPPSNSWNTYNTSPGGFNEQLKQPSSNSYGASTAYSPQTPNNSWNKYDTTYGENVMKSTQPSSNSWNNSNTSFGWPTTNSSHPPSNSWNNHNTNTANSTEPSTSLRNSSNSHVGYSADSFHSYPANSNQPSSYSWNNNSTSFPGASANPPLLSSSTWNNSREGFSSGFPQANNGLPAQAHSLNGGVNGNYGYSGKSLEGSCVKEPDPLDMSEEAKAERWFRRAAQIKDISELSQIPDEDFPQIMPMRKGVNRFVVSKRKTPLERRLASQQYKRSLPVVSSEPETDPTAGEKEN